MPCLVVHPNHDVLVSHLLGDRLHVGWKYEPLGVGLDGLPTREDKIVLQELLQHPKVIIKAT